MLAAPIALLAGASFSSVAVAGDDDDDGDDDDGDDDDDGGKKKKCKKKKKAPPTPDGYEGYIVLMGNGEMPAGDPLINETDFFFTDIMGFSPAEFEAFKQDRYDFFDTQYGIADAETDPDTFLFVGFTDPAANYRAFTVGDRKVPSEGWVLREGVVSLIVTNPAGLTLGGNFAGEHVPPGTILGSGVYNIEVTNKNGVPTGEEIVIDFLSASPIIPQGDGNTLFFFCDVISDEFGNGLAQGISNPAEIAPGIVKQNIRNIVTFSTLGGL